MTWRSRVQASDRDTVRRLVAATGFFSAQEEDIAVELVDEAWVFGSMSGYEFIFAETEGDGEALQGYACYGPIQPDSGSFDLYWIVVSPRYQGNGLGKQLLREAERRALAEGADEMLIDTSGRDQYRPTRAFYERMGYRIHEVVHDFYAPGDDKVVYRRSLVPGQFRS